MEEKEKKESSLLINIVISIFLLAILIGGVFLYKNTPKEEINKTLNAGEISYIYYNEDGTFNLSTIKPLTEEEAKSTVDPLNVYNFKLETDFSKASRKKLTYSIRIVQLSSSKVNDDKIMVSLEKLEDGAPKQVLKPILLSNLKSKILYTADSVKDENIEFKLKLFSVPGSTLVPLEKNSIKLSVVAK